MSETCRDFDALIARSAQLTKDEAAKLGAHLASCASCRELIWSTAGRAMNLDADPQGEWDRECRECQRSAVSRSAAARHRPAASRGRRRMARVAEAQP